MSQKIEKAELRAELDIAYELHLIREALQDIARSLQGAGKTAATAFTITQTGENQMPTNNTIVLGQVGTFTSSLFPAGSVLATPTTVPVWTCNDPLATLTPDVTGFNVAVATSASDTATSLVLTETAPTLGGAIISTPLTVTLLPATGGGGVPATGFIQFQVS